MLPLVICLKCSRWCSRYDTGAVLVRLTRCCMLLLMQVIWHWCLCGWQWVVTCDVAVDTVDMAPVLVWLIRFCKPWCCCWYSWYSTGVCTVDNESKPVMLLLIQLLWYQFWCGWRSVVSIDVAVDPVDMVRLKLSTWQWVVTRHVAIDTGDMVPVLVWMTRCCKRWYCCWYNWYGTMCGWQGMMYGENVVNDD